MSSKMETLSQCLKRTISEGSPLYNDGKKQECYELYLEAAKYVVAQDRVRNSTVGQLLEQAIDEAEELGGGKQEQGPKWGEAAWVLRHFFDDILDKVDDTSKSRRALLLDTKGGSDDAGYAWQDDKASNVTDFEKGQSLADIAYILRASITPKGHTRFTKSYDNCFPGSEAVQVLTSLGLAANRKMAVEKCCMLLSGSFVFPVSHEAETTFKDGTRLYRFSYREELQAKMDELSSASDNVTEGSEQAILICALQTTLELPTSLNSSGETGEEIVPATFGGVSTRHLQPRRSSLLSKEQLVGHELAQQAADYERAVDIKDRKHNFKPYHNCFVGNEAVTALVDKGLSTTRDQAVQHLEGLLQANLIQHVTHEHLFQDKRLFYQFTSVGDIKKSIDTLAVLPSTPTGQALVKYTALVQRYKQFAGLDVTSILNSFFGCADESGWDLVDLENWRHNMKRWGFGRREDQDDDMVANLSPLCVNVDPETWDKTGDEQWESPYGILAQIAIFDQISRSAFRGTPDAFKWDELAIRATKVAIEKGYFETAYQSSLNQFLILLPLEHSESWEDQKLGVTLLLQMLSKTAVQDEGLSDYEIVKRLEFSKRLTTAFLEHAQVIAKFKRYPHRNRPHGRTATLEERVWLASDLVPRWAKSQNPEDARNVIQLPVIPLKKLTKGK